MEVVVVALAFTLGLAAGAYALWLYISEDRSGDNDPGSDN